MVSVLMFLENYTTMKMILFLIKIVMGHQTWVSCVNLEKKNQRSGGILTHKIQNSVCNLFCQENYDNCLLDRRVILFVEFTECGTINSEVYCETLKKLRKPMQNKCQSILSSGVVFLNDNTQPHIIEFTQTLLHQLKWEVFDYPHPHTAWIWNLVITIST